MTSVPIRLLAFSFTAAVAAAQQPAGQDAALQALLKEVHELRVALERSNQIGPRVQIALARMQLAEERVRNANRQLLDYRERVADVQNKSVEVGSRIKQQEARQAQSVDPNERKSLELELADLKAQLDQFSALGAQLQAKEADANGALMNEQARWNEANDLLTSIERLMAPAQP